MLMFHNQIQLELDVAILRVILLLITNPVITGWSFTKIWQILALTKLLKHITIISIKAVAWRDSDLI